MIINTMFLDTYIILIILRVCPMLFKYLSYILFQIITTFCAKNCQVDDKNFHFDETKFKDERVVFQLLHFMYLLQGIRKKMFYTKYKIYYIVLIIIVYIIFL